MTNQSRPLFTVGEQVILQSEYLSQFNGEYFVEEVVMPYNKIKCRLTGRKIYSDVVAYRLDFAHKHPDFDGVETLWRQESLRKKYPPSSQSFSELMNTLKSSEKV